MEIYKETIFDISTNKVTNIKFNEEELKEFELNNQEAETLASKLREEEKLIELSKQSAKEKLAALGLTPDEISAITGA